MFNFVADVLSAVAMPTLIHSLCEYLWDFFGGCSEMNEICDLLFKSWILRRDREKRPVG